MYVGSYYCYAGYNRRGPSRALRLVVQVSADCDCCESPCSSTYDMTSRFPTPAEFASFPPPNYDDPATKLPLALSVVIPMTVLVVAFISCRFYCRTVLVNTLGWDDWTMLVAAVSSVTNVPN
jgi:hypothetical protein